MIFKNNPQAIKTIKNSDKNKIRKNTIKTTAHTIKKLNNKTNKCKTNLKGRRSKFILFLFSYRFQIVSESLAD
jgi:hypothetical protein